MTLLINRPGVLTTVQDLGRRGWRSLGINPNGPMDPAAARVANLLVGNDDNAALLEMHFPAAEITFGRDAIFSICGADFGAELEAQKLLPWRAAIANAGETIRFATKRSGERCYLAVRGGIDVPQWLGSSSTNLGAKIGGFQGRGLQAGDRVSTHNASHRELPAWPAASSSLIPRYSRSPPVRIVRGAEFDLLSASSRANLLKQAFTVTTDSDRMGFRLRGETLRLNENTELVSSAVCFGTIQLLPNGRLIVLMADQQTAGGYPRIGHVISRDLPLLGQLGANDKVAFHLVETGEAESLALAFERDLSFFRAACRLAYA